MFLSQWIHFPRSPTLSHSCPKLVTFAFILFVNNICLAITLHLVLHWFYYQMLNQVLPHPSPKLYRPLYPTLNILMPRVQATCSILFSFFGGGGEVRDVQNIMLLGRQNVQRFVENSRVLAGTF